MNKYEGFFLLDNKESKADWNGVQDHVTSLLEKYECSIHTIEKWGERKLAYEISRHRRGTYLLIYFEAKTGALDELRRDLQLSEKVIRHLFLRLEEFPEIPEPSEEGEGTEGATEGAPGAATPAEGTPAAAAAEGEAAPESAPAEGEKPAETAEATPGADATPAATAESPAGDAPADSGSDAEKKEATAG